MKCNECGATLPAGTLRCNYCGGLAQIVPDYNPLEEVIEDEIRTSLMGERKEVSTSEDKRFLDEDYADEQKVRKAQAREAEQRRRREQEKRKVAQQKKKIKKIIITFSLIIIAIIIIFLVYTNSYQGKINKGMNELNADNYASAKSYFTSAIEKEPKRIEAYEALAELFVEQEDLDAAEELLLEAYKENIQSTEFAMMVAEFYLGTKQNTKVMPFYNEILDESIQNQLMMYMSNGVQFSLPPGQYEDVQKLSLESEESKIYYTVDGSEATVESIKYTEPIQISEGTTVVRAISVNEKGVPSIEVKNQYIVELPIEMAPIVSPSTGLYREARTISVTVPDGYVAYYTLNNTIPYENGAPTAGAKKYTGPIEMPEGNTIFTTVLVNASGKMSDITKRNYELILKEEEVVPTFPITDENNL